ncbi:MAG TPA: hypothetical protein VIJ24_06595, partial [Verrucomicrobiae bacterium]
MLQLLLLLLHGTMCGLQLLGQFLALFAQPVVFSLQLGKFLGQTLVFGAEAGVFRAQRGDTGIFELIQIRLQLRDLLLGLVQLDDRRILLAFGQ